ncbi:hypothetical protein PBY51_019186 [Eleginops maclovinus]|uniref:Uncharacterized protein n=1 Tax=Eleginops maclovinus TaxID=56733 RepID=A0AAN7Y201_ELEMC|nr:hypothetical protein PBY51_019186 [Eleginops maclovinus]
MGVVLSFIIIVWISFYAWSDHYVFLPMFNECVSPLLLLIFTSVGRCVRTPLSTVSALGLSAGAAALPGLSYSRWHSDAQITYTAAPLWTQGTPA